MVVGEDVVRALKFCFQKSYMYYSMSSTAISLIPRTSDAIQMKDFRPISCCNVLYKAFSAILTSILKRVMIGLVGNQQSTLHEMARGYHSERGKPRAVL